MFSKIGGLNSWAFTEALSTNVIKIAYKTEHREKQKKNENESISIEQIMFLITLGPNGTRITMVS